MADFRDVFARGSQLLTGGQIIEALALFTKVLLDALTLFQHGAHVVQPCKSWVIRLMPYCVMTRPLNWPQMQANTTIIVV